MVFFTPLAVNLLGFKANAVDNSSVINIGPMLYVDQFVSYKRNQAVGEQNGDFSPITLPISSILDTDVIDSTSAKNSVV